MKTSVLLSKARRYLWDGHGPAPYTGPESEYICYAVFAVGADDRDTLKVRDSVERCLSWVSGGAECFSFEAALIVAGVPAEYYNNPEWLQLRRREFLTNMISYFERKGD